MLLEYGPVTMILEAVGENGPDSAIACAGAESVLDHFEALAAVLPAAKAMISAHDGKEQYPRVLQIMIQAVRSLGEKDFTAMAAVAGTLSDLAVERMSREGAGYAMANNGGDIAFTLTRSKKEMRVGVVSDLAVGVPTHRVVIPYGSGIGGVATSGFGGRSLTRGVASAVTVMAKNGALADAAATAIANACDTQDPAVQKCLAEEMDYDTDIRGLSVTRSVGTMSDLSISEALVSGAERASELCDQGMIEGAVLFVAGCMELRWRGKYMPFSLEKLSSFQ